MKTRNERKSRVRPLDTDSYWELTLYVAGLSPRSIIAIENLQSICKEHLAGRYRIEIVDVAQHPERAQSDQVRLSFSRAQFGRASVIANRDLEAAHLASLNMMEDAVASSLRASNEELQAEIGQRRRAEDEVRRLNAELEKRVRLRTAQLEAANRELESFSYSVSHDLQAPLRAIDGFTALLHDRIDGSIDAESRDLFERVRKAAARMSQLIDALLALARIGRQSLRIGEIDLSAMAREIAAELQESDSSRAATFSIPEGFRARGDAALLRIVLENLIRNAWKFTSRRERAVIEFGRRETDAGPEFSVRDNGAGFDAAYADRLFAPFQRLHAQTEFRGTGIGLAIVERIIAKHGGSVTADGEPDAGAAFFFTLPAAKEAEP